jgi:hypothetical protein
MLTGRYKNDIPELTYWRWAIVNIVIVFIYLTITAFLDGFILAFLKPPVFVNIIVLILTLSGAMIGGFITTIRYFVRRRLEFNLLWSFAFKNSFVLTI